jgi:hypothetical protein
MTIPRTIGKKKRGRGWAMEIKHNTSLDTKSYLGTPYFMNMSERQKMTRKTNEMSIRT